MKKTITKTRSNCALGLLAVLIFAGLATPVSAQLNSELFQKFEFFTCTAEKQTVLTGFFSGGATAELAVVHIDEQGDRRLHIYGLDEESWRSVYDATLSKQVLFVDVASMDGRDRLITYRHGQVSWFDTETANERPLARLSTVYKTLDRYEIPQLDVTHDLNHDGRDDLLVPDLDGFWVSVQANDGAFSEPVKIGPADPLLNKHVGNLFPEDNTPGDPNLYRDVGINVMTAAWYQSRVRHMDYNQDGLDDLVFWNEDHFDVYLQNDEGGFDTSPIQFSIDVPFHSDGVYTRMFDYSKQGAFSAVFAVGVKTSRTMLHSILDLNGDQVADLVTLTMTGRSFSKQRSLYEVYFGTAAADGIVFAQEAGAVIKPKGRAGAMQPWGYSSQTFEDFDSDGQIDIMFRDVNVGLGGMTRALLGNSVPVNLEFYRPEDGQYPDKPTAKRKIRRFNPLAGPGNVFFPPVLMGDINGDGRSDLVVGENPKELNVFFGIPGPAMLTRKPQKIPVVLPRDERNTWLVDLNEDGKKDIVMHHVSEEEPHRLAVLMVY